MRQSYIFTIKKLSTIQRFRRNKGADVKARKASKKIKTIAERLICDVGRKLRATALNNYRSDLNLFTKVLAQKRGDSNKFIVFTNLK